MAKSVEKFRDALIAAIKAGKTQTQFADEFAAESGVKSNTIKQRYMTLVRELKATKIAEEEAGRAENVERLNKAISALKFAGGRSKEEKTVESMTSWIDLA